MFEYKEENKAYFIMSVTDLPKAKEFYKNIFGFEVIWDYKIGGLSQEVGWAELALPFYGARIGLNYYRKEKSIKNHHNLAFTLKM